VELQLLSCFVNIDVQHHVDIHKAGEKLEFHTTQMKKGQARKAMRLASRNVLFEKAVAMITDHRLSNPNKKLRAKTVLQSCLPATRRTRTREKCPLLWNLCRPCLRAASL